MSRLKLGIKIISDEQLSILMYIDDIILTAETKDDLQKMIDIYIQSKKDEGPKGLLLSTVIISEEN